MCSLLLLFTTFLQVACLITTEIPHTIQDIAGVFHYCLLSRLSYKNYAKEILKISTNNFGKRSNIFACLFIIHNIISLSRHK